MRRASLLFALVAFPAALAAPVGHSDKSLALLDELEADVHGELLASHRHPDHHRHIARRALDAEIDSLSQELEEADEFKRLMEGEPHHELERNKWHLSTQIDECYKIAGDLADCEPPKPSADILQRTAAELQNPEPSSDIPAVSVFPPFSPAEFRPPR